MTRYWALKFAGLVVPAVENLRSPVLSMPSVWLSVVSKALPGIVVLDGVVAVSSVSIML